jgi:4-hydroxy-3-polyprenylbenzoate decarboxylase
MASSRTITVAFTGASGMPYGLQLLECLFQAAAQVQLLYSPAAQIVAKQECDLTLPSQPREAVRMPGERYRAREGQLRVFAREDWLAPVASGSNPGDSMAICPCTMGTLGAIAAGLADNLIERAADVPRTIDDLVDFVVARVLDHLQVAHDLLPRWGSPPGDAGPASGSA